MHLQRKEGRPGRAYERAMDFVRQLAEGDDYSAGDKIPSERDLAERLGLSRMTVRKAIEELVRAGVLERRSTSGTVVAPAKVVRPLDPSQVLGIPQIIRNSGGAPASRLLYFDVARADETLAMHLALRPGDAVVAVRMLQMSDGIPFCVEKSYLPAARVPGLGAADIEDGAPPLYRTLAERYGIRVTRTEGVLSAATASPEDAALLGLAETSFTLIYRVTVFDQDDVPIERAISINNPRRTVFSTDRRIVVDEGTDSMRAMQKL